MSHSIADIARATGLEAAGDLSLTVTRPTEPQSAGPTDLAMAMNRRYGDALAAGQARAALLWPDADWQALGLEAALFAPKPRVALAKVTDTFQHPADVAPGVHPLAAIDPTAELGADVRVGPFAVIGPGARIGARSIIAPHVTIGAEVDLGPDALLHAGTRIGARCLIGARFLAQPNAVVGADGFSFEPPERGSVDTVRATGSVEGAAQTARFLRIHSLAAVEIGEDVELGAGSTIDRGTLAPTRIGAGTKIDNLVQIGHNVQIGETCLVCAQVGIAGSTRIGDRVVLGGKVGLRDHLKVGSDVVFAAGTLVSNHVEDRSVMMGIPAVPRAQALRQIASVRRLPGLIEDVAEIRRKLGL